MVVAAGTQENNMNPDRVNGYGVLFRFVTPILITMLGALTLMLISDIKSELGHIKSDARIAAVGMVNHLEHHRVLEVNLADRLSSIETMLDKRLKRR